MNIAERIVAKYPGVHDVLSSCRGLRDDFYYKAWFTCVDEMREGGIRPVDQARALGYVLQDGHDLADALQKSGIPQTRLAAMFGVGKTTVNKWVLSQALPEGGHWIFLREMFPNTPIDKRPRMDPLCFLVALLAEEGLLEAAQATYKDRFGVDFPFRSHRHSGSPVPDLCTWLAYGAHRDQLRTEYIRTFGVQPPF